RSRFFPSFLFAWFNKVCVFLKFETNHGIYFKINKISIENLTQLQFSIDFEIYFSIDFSQKRPINPPHFKKFPPVIQHLWNKAKILPKGIWKKKNGILPL
ncbi:MAG TPA: hypothetical protein DEQ87_16655, partial [Algoriphagus sp.]|uniref:hypothetical protein n=1 Tax=Algoriphagus sp. TaxID=1872435 RepID=UPI000EEE957D